MNQRTNIYHRLLLRQRRRYADDGREWPGSQETAGAVTKYPNILAEMDASGETLEDLAEYARVSPGIMAAVIESGEELKGREARRLAFRLADGKAGYLTAHMLQLVNPKNKRGKELLRRLETTAQAAEGLPVEHPGQVQRVREALRNGRPVTYADYRWASLRLRQALEKKEKVQARNRRIRTERIC